MKWGDSIATRQRQVDARFDAEVETWSDVYSGGDAFSRIMQYRARLVRRWVADLDLGPAPRVLDAGCGTAVVAAELAAQGARVVGFDRASAMSRRAAARAAEPAVAGRLAILQASATEIPLSDAQFDLAIGLGLLMWLSDPSVALRELVRVTRGGGYVLVHAINPRRIDYRLDRWLTPTHGRLSIDELEALLISTGIQPLRRATYGFGPFTIGGRTVLPGRAGGAVHGVLQTLSDAGLQGLARAGGHHLVLGQVRG
jgi:ubiquinone/menaquinone biosynthesis C-methylase UbiE